MTSVEADYDAGEFRRFEQSRWAVSAGGYADRWVDLTVQTAPALLDSFDAGGGALLDVACGPGTIVRYALDAGWRVTGVDFSERMVEIAKTRVPEAEIKLGDAEQLDFDDATFDCVTMNFGILHLAMPSRAVSEAFRVLTPGGHFAFTVWEEAPRSAAFEMALSAVAVAGRPVQLPAGPAFFAFSDHDLAVTAMQQAGFVEVSRRVVDMKWRLESSGELFDAFAEGTARTGAVLSGQPDECRAAVKAEIARRMETYAVDDGGYVVPMAAIVISGTKPKAVVS